MPILALVGGLFLVLQPLFVSGFAAVPGGPRDARLVHFALEHAHRFLLRLEPHFELWDPPLFYPARNVAAHTDLLLSLTPFYSPWRLLGAPPDTAFQLWLITVWALNFGAFQLFLTRVLRVDPAAAAAGAYLFAFGSSRVANTTHPQLIPGFYLVLALYALFRSIELDGSAAGMRRRRRGWISVFFLALVLQFYGAFYMLFFFSFFCALAAALALGWRPSRLRLLRLARHEASTLAATGFVAAALAAPLAERYLLTTRTLGLRTWAHVEPLLPRWQAWLLMGHDNWLYGWIHESELLPAGELWRSSTQASGLGLVATACAIAGLWHRRRRLSTRFLAALWLLAVLLTTRWPGGWTLWKPFFGHLPGAGGIRAVGRVGILLLIPAGIGVAYFFERRLKSRRGVLAAALGLLMAFEHGSHIPRYDKEEARRRVEAIGGRLEPGCRTFHVEAMSARPGVIRPDGARPGLTVHEDAMWVALDTGVPTINGRYGNDPPGWKLRRADRMPPGPARHATIEWALDEWIRYNCLDPSEVCRLEIDGEPSENVERPPSSKWEASCSGH